MQFLGTNVKYDDCMVVALYNAVLAMGQKITYEEVLKLSLNKGWYKPGQAFPCKYLSEAFAHFKLHCNELPRVKNTKKLFKSVVEENKVYVFFRPSQWDSLPGHAMVATKGDRGVKVFNPYIEGTGWKSMTKEIRSGKDHYVFEIVKALC